MHVIKVLYNLAKVCTIDIPQNKNAFEIRSKPAESQINSFPYNHEFDWPCVRNLLKTVWKRRKCH